jgi:hypothetical protein
MTDQRHGNSFAPHHVRRPDRVVAACEAVEMPPPPHADRFAFPPEIRFIFEIPWLFKRNGKGIFDMNGMDTPSASPKDQDGLGPGHRHAESRACITVMISVAC